MTLAQDKIKDRIFELEMEQKEIQMCLTQATFISTQEYYNKLSQENQYWIAYYKDRLKDIENEEKYDE
ncbi:hypothetical protein [Aeromonas phage 4L372XY]|uniref:Uncharacterized protein n=1 Tax=Aeromonas phage 4L372XY TaxID=2588520 RepID=A0A5B9N845_9CAUD|nr:hypothetical protein HWC28_gp061 [Aeromonas phage 4L372XY]QEG08776.1 hypothetical protein [Aeromonas phage 4L372XY]